MIFPKKPWDGESFREAVRNVKKSRDSRQNRELGPAWGVEEQLLISSSCFIISPGRVQKVQKFINFCLKVGHSANLKHSKSTRRQLTLLWKLENNNQAQHFFLGGSWRGRLGTIDLRQLSFWYRVLSCEPTNYESVHTWVTHLHTAVPTRTRSLRYA